MITYFYWCDASLTCYLLWSENGSGSSLKSDFQFGPGSNPSIEIFTKTFWILLMNRKKYRRWSKTLYLIEKGANLNYLVHWLMLFCSLKIRAHSFLGSHPPLSAATKFSAGIYPVTSPSKVVSLTPLFWKWKLYGVLRNEKQPCPLCNTFVFCTT